MSESLPDNHAPAGRMILAIVSLLWLIVGSLALTFIVMLGTLACGAICGEMAFVWLATAAVLLAMLLLAVRLLLGIVRRRLPDGLMRLVMIGNIGLLFAAAGIAALLGAGG